MLKKILKLLKKCYECIFFYMKKKDIAEETLNFLSCEISKCVCVHTDKIAIRVSNM